MAGGSIKGITISFAGDTTKLDKALRQIKNSTKDIDSELKQVNKALKFNPTSVELWRQKQDLLKQKIKETENGLKELKSIQAQMDAQGVDKQSEAYRRIQREITESESKLKTFNTELRKIGQVNLRAMSEQFKEMGNKLESAGQAMRGISAAAAALAASIGALTVKSGQWADDLNTMSKRYRIGTDDLQMYAAAAELVDVDVETIAATHRKLTKSMSSAESGTGKQAEAFKALDIAVTDSNGQLRDSDEVWNEVIQKLSLVENETEREALAMDLLGKSAGDLNPLLEDGGETYQKLAETMQKYGLEFIDQETLDQANAFNDSLDTIKAVGLVAFQQLGTQLAAYLAPAMEKVVNVVGKLANWFSNLSPRTQAIIAAIAGVVAVVSPLLIGLGKLSMGIGAIIKLIAIVGPAIGGIVAALGPVILIIAAVVAAGVLLYKNWDTIKAKATALWNSLKATFNGIKTTITTVWNTIKTSVSNTVDSIKTKITNVFNAIKTATSTAWNGIKSAITSPITTAIGIVKDAINKIKGFFPISIGKVMSNLKLPHFKLSGKFDLKTLSVPHLSVEWYKTGGIFDSPSIIGVGEAGSEAVVPLDRFWKTLEGMNTGETNIVININGAGDPRAVAEEVKRVLIRETNQRRLAWQ